MSRHTPTGNHQERARALIAADDEGIGLEYVGTSAGGSRYDVRTHGWACSIPAVDVTAWVDGYRAAATAAGEAPPDVAAAAAGVRAIFDGSSLADQCRLQLISWLEHGGVTQVELARRVGVNNKTVADALRFNHWFSMEMADRMITALGRRWVLGSVVADAPQPAPDPAVPLAGWLARLQRLVGLHERGWLVYVGPANPNLARPSMLKSRTTRQVNFELAVGATVHRVGSREVDAWLDGLSTYHAGRVTA